MALKILLVGLVMLRFMCVNAQVPTITSFSPQSGPIGTSVTITGTNFDSALANNIVYFGATKATVTAATTTQLTVTVPSGATYQPITVTANGLTAYSSAPFIVTFPGGGVIDVNSFLPKVDFTAGITLGDVTIGDVDGDGKPDLAVLNSNLVSVLRNTSVIGLITSSSFDAKVDFGVGSDPNGVAISDVNGDGKPDLSVSSVTNGEISVLRSTSVPSSVLFASRIGFYAPGVGIAIGDLDMDGKPDLATGNNSDNTVSVLRNVIVSGSITSGSFAPRIDFPTENFPMGVAIGDLDGDGKPDLAVAANGGNAVSVLRNTSVSSSITFASKVDYITGGSPRSVAIGDIDGDGKQDLIVANYGTSSVTVLRNSSVSGSIAFASGVNFTTGTNPDNVAIGDLDGDSKPDLVLANLSSNTVSVFRNTSVPGFITSSSFASKVDFATATGLRGVAIGDLDGDGKPDLVITNGSNAVSVFSNQIVASLHVSPSGSDGNDGSVGSPLRNIQTALTMAQTGNVIKVAGGTYQEGLITQSAVTIRGGYSSDFTDPNRNIYTNKTTVLAISTVLLNDAYGCTIDGFVFDCNNTAQQGINTTSASTIMHNVIRRCRQSPGQGINISGAALVANNTIHDNITGTILFGGSSASSVFKNNILTGNSFGLNNSSAAGLHRYNCVQGNSFNYTGNFNTPGIGDISLDPQYQNSASGDFRLNGNSPALDRGDPADDFSSEPIPNGGRIDMGTYGGTALATIAWAPEPTAHASTFTATSAGTNQINLTFSAASTITNAFGYIILRRQDGGNPTSSGITDGAAASATPTAGTTLVTTITNTTTTTYNDASAGPGIQYNYAIIPYGYDGSNAQTYNYRTVATIPTSNAITLSLEPATHAATFTATGAGSSQINLTFSAASAISNAAGYIIVRRQDGTNPTSSGITDGAAAPATPTAGTTLVTTITNTTTTTYSDVSASPAVQYTYAIIPYGYNGTNAQTYNYRTAASIPTANTFTFSLEPTVQSPGPITFSNITANSFDGTFPVPTPAPNGYLVLMSANVAPNFVPVDGIEYAFNSVVGNVSGNDIYVVQNTNVPGFNIVSISPPVTLYFKVYSFNGSGATINYLTTAPLSGSQAPIPAEPTIQASNLNITQPFASTLQLNWTNGNGASRLVVGKAGGLVNQAPVDGATYAASSTFSGGDDLGNGNYVVYKGSGNSVSVTAIQPGTSYQFFVFEYNGTSGLENYLTSTATGNPATFTSSGSADTTPPAVASNNTPTAIAPDTNLVVTANFTDVGGSGVGFAELEYRPIAGAAPNNFITVNMVNTAGPTFEYTILANKVTELGIEYKFLLTDLANNNNSANQTLYRTRIAREKGLPIPYASPGRAVSNYRIIAVPLELESKSMNSVLGDELENYDPTKWIMYRYNGDRFAELTGSTLFEIGKGYWLLTPNTTPLNSGPGNSADVGVISPFQITLNPGWNQIGNPYNFDISWADVLLANPTNAPNLGNNSKIRVYRGTVSDEDELLKFEGGFVRNTSTSNIIIDIPVAKNTSINGRKREPDAVRNSLDQPDWEIIFDLKQGNTENNLGGIGMHREASGGFDFHDDFNLPRFIEYLEVKFPKQRVGMTYTKDIVPPSENFVWQFAVESNLKEETISIGWNNSYFGNSKEVYLLDLSEHRFVDMRAKENYNFNRVASKEFKVIYGNSDFVKMELIPHRIVLYEPYPNPFIDQVSIEYALPQESVTITAEIGIYDALGAKLSSVDAPQEAGLGKWIWEGGANPSGLYFVRIRLGDQVVTKKLLKR